MRFVPRARLLTDVDVVEHHGGSGTTLSAAGAGVSQLVLAQGADQFSNAAEIAAMPSPDEVADGWLGG